MLIDKEIEASPKFKKLWESSVNNWKVPQSTLIFQAYHNVREKRDYFSYKCFEALVIKFILDGNAWGKGTNQFEKENVAKNIFEHMDEIGAGTFNVTEQPSQSGTSKVCHVLNPQKYPFIYDTNNRINFFGNDKYVSESVWREKVAEMQLKYKDQMASENDIFILDSKLWAVRRLLKEKERQEEKLGNL